jgi:hypothetical protein
MLMIVYLVLSLLCAGYAKSAKGLGAIKMPMCVVTTKTLSHLSRYHGQSTAACSRRSAVAGSRSASATCLRPFIIHVHVKFITNRTNTMRFVIIYQAYLRRRTYVLDSTAGTSNCRAIQWTKIKQTRCLQHKQPSTYTHNVLMNAKTIFWDYHCRGRASNQYCTMTVPIALRTIQ